MKTSTLKGIPEQSMGGLGLQEFSDVNLVDEEDVLLTHCNLDKKDEEAILAATGLSKTNTWVWGF
jgi:hypothetical protein